MIKTMVFFVLDQRASNCSCSTNPGLGVERTQRLVHQDQLRIVNQRANDIGPLAHPARQFVGIVVLESVQSDLRDQIARSLPSLTLLQTSDLQRDLDIFNQGAPREEIVFLRDVTDLCRYAVDSIAAKKNTTGAGTEQPHDQIR